MLTTGKLQVARLEDKIKGKKSEHGYQRQQTAGEITLVRLIQPSSEADKQRTTSNNRMAVSIQSCYNIISTT